MYPHPTHFPSPPILSSRHPTFAVRIVDTMASTVDAYLEAQEKNAGGDDAGDGLPELFTMFKIGDCVRSLAFLRSLVVHEASWAMWFFVEISPPYVRIRC